MGAPEVPRKDIVEPSPAHLKEVDTKNTTSDSGWDIPEEGQSKRRHIHLGVGASATGWAVSDRFDRMLPPHRRYFGRSRRTFLIIVLVILLALLALIIGLAVGLTKGSDKYMVPSRLHQRKLTSTYQDPGSPFTEWRQNLHWRSDVLQPWPWRLWH